MQDAISVELKEGNTIQTIIVVMITGMVFYYRQFPGGYRSAKLRLA